MVLWERDRNEGGLREADISNEDHRNSRELKSWCYGVGSGGPYPDQDSVSAGSAL